MKNILKQIRKNKRAVSLMVSYVLLVSIVIIVSMLLFTFIREIINNANPISDCEDGTSVVLLGVVDQGNAINLSLKNNGKFSFDWVRISAGSKDGGAQYLLIPDFSGGFFAGHYKFPEKLKPGESSTATFTLKYMNIKTDKEEILRSVSRLNIQPFIQLKDYNYVYCSGSTITQDIQEIKNIAY